MTYSSSYICYVDNTIKRPCAPSNPEVNCVDFKKNEKECLKNNCTWLARTVINSE